MQADAGEEMEAEFAPETICIRGPECTRKRGGYCPENCLWMHFAGERHPRCFGLYLGRGVVPGTGAEAERTRRVCGACAYELDCIVETGKRFDLDDETVGRWIDAASEKY